MSGDYLVKCLFPSRKDHGTSPWSPEDEHDYVSALLVDLVHGLRSLHPEAVCRGVIVEASQYGIPQIQSLKRIQLEVAENCRRNGFHFFHLRIPEPSEPLTSRIVALWKNHGVNEVTVDTRTFLDEVAALHGFQLPREELRTSLFEIRDGGIAGLGIALPCGTPLQTGDHLREELRIVREIFPTRVFPFDTLETSEVPQKLQTDSPIDFRIRCNRVLQSVLEFIDLKPFTWEEFTLPFADQRRNVPLATLEIGVGARTRFQRTPLLAGEWVNPFDLDRYLDEVLLADSRAGEFRAIPPAELVSEDVVRCLSTPLGLPLNRTKERFGAEMEEIYPGLIKVLEQNDLVTTRDNTLHLTARGRVLRANVLKAFEQPEVDSLRQALLDYDSSDERTIGYVLRERARNGLRALLIGS